MKASARNVIPFADQALSDDDARAVVQLVRDLGLSRGQAFRLLMGGTLKPSRADSPRPTLPLRSDPGSHSGRPCR